jgi:hypothetical protein
MLPVQMKWTVMLAGIVFPPHLTRIPVFPERDETGMPQMIVQRPFHVLELGDQHRFQPAALLHLVSGEPCPQRPLPASGRFTSHYQRGNMLAQFFSISNAKSTEVKIMVATVK